VGVDFMTANADSSLTTIRVDHVGSLLRPDFLKEAITRFQAGQASETELWDVQTTAIREVIDRQEALGFPIVTDGEFRRTNFQDSFTDSVSGYPADRRSNVARRPVEDRIRLTRNLPLEEYRASLSLTHRPLKMTLVSADRLIQRLDGDASRHVYPRIEEFVEDVVAIERQIVAELAAEGCRYIQIDAPGYTAYVDPPLLAEMRAKGEDPDQNLQRSMEADNAVIRDFPDVTFGIHLCRGNTDASLPPPRQGHYDAIAERLFNTLEHQRFLLEYDNERAGTFEPLRFVPKGKVVVLGLVSTKVRAIEEADELKRRIDEASKYLPVEQLALSPQCGFSSALRMGPNRLTDDEQWGKLEQVQRVAEEVWR
jgi:5-methyltetrahydropteroyltriglutamate--homocysteine methyltransferase